MMKPTRQDILLSIIAFALCVIAIKLVFFDPPTRGDLAALREINNPDQRKAAVENFMNRTPVVWVRGGDIDVNVTGGSVDVSGSSVEIER